MVEPAAEANNNNNSNNSSSSHTVGADSFALGNPPTTHRSSVSTGSTPMKKNSSRYSKRPPDVSTGLFSGEDEMETMDAMSSLASLRDEFDQDSKSRPKITRTHSTPSAGWGAERPELLKRSSSAEALFCRNYDVLDSFELHGLVKELVYHTDLCTKQLRELQERIDNSEMELAVNEQPFCEAISITTKSAPSSPHAAKSYRSVGGMSLTNGQSNGNITVGGSSSTIPASFHGPPQSDSLLANIDFAGDSERLSALQAVLRDFDLPTDPSALRASLLAAGLGSGLPCTPMSTTQPLTSRGGGGGGGGTIVPDVSLAATLPRRTTPKVASHRRKHLVARLQSGSSLNGKEALPMSPTSSDSSQHTPARKSHQKGVKFRMAVRLQIVQFLKEPQKRVKILNVWRHEAAQIPAIQMAGSCFTTGSQAEKWFKKVYSAFESTLSNLLDENDVSIREVLIDFVRHEVRDFDPSTTVTGGGNMMGATMSSVTVSEHEPRPPTVEAMRKIILTFGEAVLDVRQSTASGNQKESGRSGVRTMWADCLSGISSRFEDALDATWQGLKPTVLGHGGSFQASFSSTGLGLGETPLDSLRHCLQTTFENSELLCTAAASITDIGSLLCRDDSHEDPEQFWGAYLRQAIKVSKIFLQLVREKTVMVSLWTSGYGKEGEHLSQAVLRDEYLRVRHAFADMLVRRTREILNSWFHSIQRAIPNLSMIAEDHRARHVNRNILTATVEWWRTGHSGPLRAACMDLVAYHWGRKKDSDCYDPNEPQLEDLEASIELFEEAILEVMATELALAAQTVVPSELAKVDAPRCRDILSRLVNELGRHLDSEWLIVQTSGSSAHSILPEPRLFQVLDWSPSLDFDFGAAKTAFLGAEVAGRYIVSHYVNRGAMGRVWVVEDRLNVETMPLCLKTFYCECECEEMSNLSVRDFKRCVLEELSQVERWLTSRTRLASSKHIVRVVRVLRDVRVVRQTKGRVVEGVLNGILMEFCDKGELTSYLWNSKENQPRAFEVSTALFLFTQLTSLLCELMNPFGDATEESNTDEATSVLRTHSQATDFSTMSGNQEGECESNGFSGAVKYLHNDIKTENLVLSGTTLKLIDFQSLTPLRKAKGLQRPSIEHATIVYQHRQPAAVEKGLEKGAEAMAVWAVGVILMRLLSAELPSDWVYQHRGLGKQEQLEKLLPAGHCLLDTSSGTGPRDLLERIFSSHRTASITDLLDHPWVMGATLGPRPIRREISGPNLGLGLLSPELLRQAEENLGAMRPQGAQDGGDRYAWLPLPGCMTIADQPPPVERVSETIKLCAQLSRGRLRVGQRRERRIAMPGTTGEEVFYEWHLTISAADEEEARLPVEEVPEPFSPLASVTASDEDSMVPTQSSGRMLWHSLRTRLVVDHFYVQLRTKDNLEDGEPSDVWWLRLKWVPPMVTGKRDTLGTLTGGHHGGSVGGWYSTCSFVQLQQLLLESRNEVSARIERAFQQEQAARRKVVPAGLKLPISMR